MNDLHAPGGLPDSMDLDRQPVSVPRRGRSGTLIPRDSEQCEDYNELSPYRLQLLDELHEIIGQPVPFEFWAVLVLSDITKFEKLLVEVRKSPYLLEFAMHACAALPLIRQQKEPRPIQRDPDANSSHSSSTRNKTLRDLAAERDKHSCVATQCQQDVPQLLAYVTLFWDDERIESWRREIFRDSRRPDNQEDSLVNLMCLSRDVHHIWNSGKFAFRPLDYNDDKSTLEVEWHWQPRVNNNKKLPVNTQLPSSRGLNHYVGDSGVPSRVYTTLDRTGVHQLRTGDVIVLRTDDPVNLPLPSKYLLDMQFVLARLVNLAGASERPDGFDGDESNDNAPIADRIEAWLSSVDSDDENDNSGIVDDASVTQVTSENPSPLSVRRSQLEILGGIAPQTSTDN
ncbi:hypothetical protein BO71DRAFT_482902 [Aspergillus ellipticus CBS 707.79]|uniref:HNH nuclease domain-containing protein n=1 Tax=Aspergillus ellipticus CBS 707.79 TaxID=1448320 RepID=A0A319E4G6_9EURO|nr:hypothetical protein BO71DRAFT_482902 [Aspergillus ellipticus CBS 707.79]